MNYECLEYYDHPQLLTARDPFDTLYLCLLYDDEPLCRYTAIRISQARLDLFMQGGIDLRTLFVAPENAGEYFDAAFDDNVLSCTRLFLDAIPEERLPASGYVMSAEEKERVVLDIPVRDRSLFDNIVRKFGWVCM